VVRVEWEGQRDDSVFPPSLGDFVVMLLPSLGVTFVSEGTVGFDRAMVSLD
jgi:hypothetical protein